MTSLSNKETVGQWNGARVPRCQGKNKHDKQCGKAAKLGSDKCDQHMNQKDS